MEIVPLSAAGDFTQTILGAIGDNIVVILGVFGFIVAYSVILALFDWAKEDRYLSDRQKFWHNAAMRRRK